MAATAPREGLAPSPTELLVGELTTLFGRLSILARGADEGPALTTTQRLALIALRAEEPVRLHALAERIDASPSTASRAVDGLVDAGLATREPDPDDRRAIRVSLSERGRQLVAERRRLVAATLEPALLQLAPDDRNDLIGLLARLNEALST